MSLHTHTHTPNTHTQTPHTVYAKLKQAALTHTHTPHTHTHTHKEAYDKYLNVSLFVSRLFSAMKIPHTHQHTLHTPMSIVNVPNTPTHTHTYICMYGVALHRYTENPDQATL